MTDSTPLHRTTIPETLPAMAAEIIRLRIIEEHAGLMRSAIEGLTTGYMAKHADTVRGALRLIAKAYDDGVASQ